MARITIDDPDDPRLDDYRHLTDAAARRAVDPRDAPEGIVVVEGAVALSQLLRSDLVVRSVLLSPSAAERVGGIVADRGPTVMVAPREILAGVTGFDVHRGVLASARRPPPRRAEDLVRDHRRFVVLEGVTDNENVGAVVRNAAGLGIDALLADHRCADPLYRRSIRVSSGWSLRLPFVRTGTTVEHVAMLRGSGVRCIALSPDRDAVPVDRAAAEGLLDGRTALVLGAEGPGLEPATLDAADVVVAVPMAAEVDSLNVATSFAVVAAFSAARRGWA